MVEPARVREYGAVLREEGRRLTDMVEQVLAFAGADSAGADRRRAVDVERLVQAAVADAGLEAAGIEARVEVEPGLQAAGDEATLAAALRNLLVNLRKYAADGATRRSRRAARERWPRSWSRTADPAWARTKSAACSSRSSAAGAPPNPRPRAAASGWPWCGASRRRTAAAWRRGPSSGGSRSCCVSPPPRPRTPSPERAPAREEIG